MSIEEDVEFSFKMDIEDEETELVSLDLYEYDEITKTWKILRTQGNNAKYERFSSLKVITQNVWFHEYMSRNRFYIQLRNFFDEKPDIICLQEVDREYLAEFRIHEGMQKEYLICDNPHQSQTFNKYGSLIIIHKRLFGSVHSFEQMKLPSRQGRSFISFNLFLKDSNDRDFVMNFGTVHLESRDSEITRRIQLRLISDRYQCRYSSALLCGDFNFDAHRNGYREKGPLENDFLRSKESNDLIKYQDIWAVLKYPDDMGYTVDYERNTMRRTERRGPVDRFRKRYDRIMLKSDVFYPSSVRLLNDEEIPEKEGVDVGTFPSDHFGVCTVIRMKEN